MDVVVTLGGDGVVNEVTNGLLKDGIGPDVPMLAPVPGGSANVFARSLGIPNDAVEATGVLLESLRDGCSREIGLGQANGRWFLANAGIGIDAEIIAAMEDHRAAGRSATPLRYLTTTLASYLRHTDRRHPALTLSRVADHGGEERIEGVFLAFVQNTSPWTYLGTIPVTPCPEASFDTGLDLFALTRLHVPAAAVAATRMLRGGGQGRAARGAAPSEAGKASAARGAAPSEAGKAPSEAARARRRRWNPREALVDWHDEEAFTVTASRPISAQIDGEGIGTVNSMVFTAHPRALRVVC
jgi:diacylglycerol kinase family enzyme